MPVDYDDIEEVTCCSHVQSDMYCSATSSISRSRDRTRVMVALPHAKGEAAAGPAAGCGAAVEPSAVDRLPAAPVWHPCRPLGLCALGQLKQPSHSRLTACGRALQPVGAAVASEMLLRNSKVFGHHAAVSPTQGSTQGSSKVPCVHPHNARAPDQWRAKQESQDRLCDRRAHLNEAPDVPHQKLQAAGLLADDVAFQARVCRLCAQIQASAHVTAAADVVIGHAADGQQVHGAHNSSILILYMMPWRDTISTHDSSPSWTLNAGPLRDAEGRHLVAGLHGAAAGSRCAVGRSQCSRTASSNIVYGLRPVTEGPATNKGSALTAGCWQELANIWLEFDGGECAQFVLQTLLLSPVCRPLGVLTAVLGTASHMGCPFLSELQKCAAVFGHDNKWAVLGVLVECQRATGSQQAGWNISADRAETHRTPETDLCPGQAGGVAGVCGRAPEPAAASVVPRLCEGQSSTRGSLVGLCRAGAGRHPE